MNEFKPAGGISFLADVFFSFGNSIQQKKKKHQLKMRKKAY